MNKIAVMQPYVFPYIGYFQLIYAADVFVFYDDVNYINRGWINRNKILLNGKDQLFTIPCIDASQNKLIKDVIVLNDKSISKILTTINIAYKKAPYFADVFPVIEKTFMVEGDISIAQLAINSVINVCEYLNLQRSFKVSSKEYNNRELKKADRLIDICHIEGITSYVNAVGGKEIYTKEYYLANGVALNFLASDKLEYEQFGNTFVPWLSIIDILMFNSKDKINDIMMRSYHLE